MELQEVYSVVKARWRFDAINYPALASTTSRERFRLFVLNHVLLHSMKQVGKIAAICEAFDHDQLLQEKTRDLVKEVAAKLITNSVQMAIHFDIEPDELERAITDSLK